MDGRGGALLIFVCGRSWIHSLRDVQHCKTEHSTIQLGKIMSGKEEWKTLGARNKQWGYAILRYALDCFLTGIASRLNIKTFF